MQGYYGYLIDRIRYNNYRMLGITKLVCHLHQVQDQLL